jgi:hypothetical protein
VVLGKGESSVLLVAVGVTVFCWVLLMAMSAEPSGAQTGGTTGETTGVSIGAQNDNANQRQYDDDNNRQYDDDDQKNRITIVEEQTIIIRTIPGKPLPPTGGLQVYVMVGVSILVGAGLLVGRLAAQRRRYR